MKEYIVYRCATCGFIMIAIAEQVNWNDNYLTCMKNGKHKDIKVVGAYDDLCECMKARKYRKTKGGAWVQE